MLKPSEATMEEATMEKEMRQIREDIRGIRAALDQIVRLDEKMINHREAEIRMTARLDKIDMVIGRILDRLQHIETLNKARSGIFAWLSGILASAVTAVVILWIKK